MAKTVSHQYRIEVETRGGRVSTTVRGQHSLNTWTRKDGGFTVRVDHNETIRFSKESAPKVVSDNR
jgi:hypothetical protein